MGAFGKIAKKALQRAVKTAEELAIKEGKNISKAQDLARKQAVEDILNLIPEGHKDRGKLIRQLQDLEQGVAIESGLSQKGVAAIGERTQPPSYVIQKEPGTSIAETIKQKQKLIDEFKALPEAQKPIEKQAIQSMRRRKQVGMDYDPSETMVFPNTARPRSVTYQKEGSIPTPEQIEKVTTVQPLYAEPTSELEAAIRRQQIEDAAIEQTKKSGKKEATLTPTVLTEDTPKVKDSEKLRLELEALKKLVND